MADYCGMCQTPGCEQCFPGREEGMYPRCDACGEVTGHLSWCRLRPAPTPPENGPLLICPVPGCENEVEPLPGQITCGAHHPPTPALDRLDFEAAEAVAWVPAPIEVSPTYRSWDEVKYQAHLNAQVAALIRQEREEERKNHATHVNNTAVGVADEVRRQYAPLVALVREWQEARKAKGAVPRGQHEAFSAASIREAKATVALAAFELGGL